MKTIFTIAIYAIFLFATPVQTELSGSNALANHEHYPARLQEQKDENQDTKKS